MGTISVTTPSDGTTADVSDYNTPINTIVNTLNGNIDADNLKANSVPNSALAGGITPDKNDANLYFKCGLYLASVKTVSSSSWIAVAFDAENYDIGGMHNNSTNPSRITIPSGGDGYYNFTGQCSLTANSAGGRGLKIAYNGGVGGSTNPKDVGGTFETADVNFPYRSAVTATRYMLAGDYAELAVYQTSGGNLDLLTDTSEYNLGTHFQCHRIL
jgi:hypothetical protein